jgi:uncharacterized protein YfaS (alpha-2-macroglobulin family)
MQPVSVSLKVNTEQSTYRVADVVIIKISLMINNLPAAEKRIRTTVYRPNGTKSFHKYLSTDQNGLASAVFPMEKKDPPGSYAVEAHSPDGSMALTSFIVL